MMDLEQYLGGLRNIYFKYSRSYLLLIFSGLFGTGCQGGPAHNAQEMEYQVAVQVRGMEYAANDPLRTSNTLVLNLNTTAGQQVLTLYGSDGTFPFPDVYRNAINLDLKVKRQPDEYFCYRSDAAVETTSPTTILGVQCDYLGPEYYELLWTGRNVALRGGALELRQDSSQVKAYGLWSALRFLEDAYLVAALSGQEITTANWEISDPDWLVVTLPAISEPGSVLQLQPHAFEEGIKVPAGKATVAYVDASGRHLHANGIVRVNGYGLDVVSHWPTVGAMAIEFTVDATLEAPSGVTTIAGYLFLAASNDPATPPDLFGIDDGRHCRYIAGQTLEIASEGLVCHDRLANRSYYRPVYRVATDCIADQTNLESGSRECIRTRDIDCARTDDFPQCE